MTEVTMSAKELLLAGAYVGAKTFYGLEDPFYGMTPEQIRGEIPGLRASLAKRKLAEERFDGGFALGAEVKALVAPCAKCQRYLLVRSSTPEGGETMMVFYIGEGALVEVLPEAGELKLRLLEDGQAVVGRVMEKVASAQIPQAEGSAALLRQQELAEIQRQAVEDAPGAKASLLDLGCSGEMAETLVSGFRHEATTHVLIRADLEKRTMDEAMAVEMEDGTVWITLSDPEEEAWEVEYHPEGLDPQRLELLCRLEATDNEMQ